MIYQINYPTYVDNRTRKEKILQEIQYRLPYLAALPDYYNYNESESQIPIHLLKKYVSDYCDSEEELR